MELIKPGININFVGMRRTAYIISVALILVTIISLAIQKGPNLGVDFTGGLLIQVKFKDTTAIKKIRDGLTFVNMQDSVIQSFGAADQNEYLIRTEREGLKLDGLARRVQDSLELTFQKGALEVRRVEMVGPKVGKDLKDSALFAIFYAILFIVIYISGRFELKWVMSIALAVALMAAVYVATLFDASVTYLIILALAVTVAVCFAFKLKYALGAIIALIHDVTITLGVFSLLDLEITLSIVAALLTIVGYSLNDTIIVFDRIRENLRKLRKTPFETVINTSINECLSRTILTSGTTLVVVLCLFFLGGPVIADFALAIIVGVVVGTYSSVYVASPILLIWPPEIGGRQAVAEKVIPQKTSENKGKSKSKKKGKGKKKR